MRILAAYVYFVRKDALLNVGAAGTTFFGLQCIVFSIGHLIPNALIFVIAKYVTAFFLGVFILRGAGIPELLVYLNTYWRLRSSIPQAQPLSPRFMGMRALRAHDRAIDDYEQARFYGAFSNLGKRITKRRRVR